MDLAPLRCSAPSATAGSHAPSHRAVRPFAWEHRRCTGSHLKRRPCFGAPGKTNGGRDGRPFSSSAMNGMSAITTSSVSRRVKSSRTFLVGVRMATGLDLRTRAQETSSTTTVTAGFFEDDGPPPTLELFFGWRRGVQRVYRGILPDGIRGSSCRWRSPWDCHV